MAPTSPNNLPADVASFVGRERELAELERTLPRTRLLTLTGAGGCGKTRLALRVAADLQQAFADGVWLIQLAPVADSSLVPRAVAATLGVRGSAGRPLLATLVTALASRRLLLLLDNCEHLIGACARLAETLLGACPHLRVLATSREPLRIPGEIIWRVPPLAVPEAELQRGSCTPELLAQVEAVALFLDRARARRSDFSLNQRNAPAVATICRRLEGLPLAIELAASQVAALPPEQIATRLDDALHLLAGGSRTQPRQETLRGALDWSHTLLSDEEQALFRRLAVFAGTFDLRASEGVCGWDGVDPTGTPALMVELVEKSLVEPQIGGGEARYRLLEPVRQYAWKRLEIHSETAELQRRHGHYYLELAESAEPKLMSGERGPWMERLAREQDNLRAVLAWSRYAAERSDREAGLRLAAALVFYWNLRGEVSEGLDWVETALARGRDAAPEVRAKALYGACELAWLAGQTELARERAEESEALWRALGDKRWLAYTLQSLPMTTDHPRSYEAVAESLRLFEEVGDAWGATLATGAADIFPMIRDGDPTGERKAQMEEALARSRALGDDWLTAHRLNFLGDLARSQGNDPEAAARYEEALELLRRQDLSGTVPSLLHNLGYLALRRGDTRRALRLFRESLALFRDQGDQRGMADCLTGTGCVLAAMGQPERSASRFHAAARLLGAAEALREAIGAAIWPANVADYERALEVIRGRLDGPALSAAWEAGRAVSFDQVVAEVLAEEPQGGSPGAPDDLLTQREREVAALVVQGLTNRQIGAQLFITEGTARLHVKHVLQKLGFTSRTQIAAWAVEQGVATAPEAQ